MSYTYVKFVCPYLPSPYNALGLAPCSRNHPTSLSLLPWLSNNLEILAHRAIYKILAYEP